MLKKFFPLNKDEWTVITFAGLSVGASLTLYLVHFNGGFSTNHTRWAEFGSYIGGLWGSTFAFLALLVLLQTMRINKEELAETRVTLEKQNTLVEQQSFEATFLSLIQILGERVESLKNYDAVPNYIRVSRVEGREALNKTSQDLVKLILDKDSSEILAHVEGYMRGVVWERHPAVMKLMPFVFIICNYIHGSQISKNKQELYLSILINELSINGFVMFLVNTFIERNQIQLNVIDELNLISTLENHLNKEFLEKLTVLRQHIDNS